MNNLGVKTFIYLALFFALVIAGIQIFLSITERKIQDIPAFESYMVPLPGTFDQGVLAKMGELAKNLTVSYSQITERTDMNEEALSVSNIVDWGTSTTPIPSPTTTATTTTTIAPSTATTAIPTTIVPPISTTTVSPTATTEAVSPTGSGE